MLALMTVVLMQTQVTGTQVTGTLKAGEGRYEFEIVIAGRIYPLATTEKVDNLDAWHAQMQTLVLQRYLRLFVARK